MSQISITILLASAFLSLFAVGEVLYHFLHVKAEYTRKLIHFGTGVLTILFPVFLHNHWYVLFLCGSFAVILTLSLRFSFLKSINAIDRKSHGSISYPAAVYLTYLAYYYNISGNHQDMRSYLIPVMTLAVCDPVAALVGKRFPWKPYQAGEGQKTVSGSLAFMVSSFLLCFSIISFNSDARLNNDLIVSFTLALVTGITEAFSRKGLDNIFIPVTSIITLWIFSHYTIMYSFD
ncbi:MAG: hypothetical protein Fur0041_18550 [Bacteroidia bacterium]